MQVPSQEEDVQKMFLIIFWDLLFQLVFCDVYHNTFNTLWFKTQKLFLHFRLRLASLFSKPTTF